MTTTEKIIMTLSTVLPVTMFLIVWGAEKNKEWVMENMTRYFHGITVFKLFALAFFICGAVFVVKSVISMCIEAVKVRGNYDK